MNEKKKIRLKPSDYQPSKAELEADVSLDFESAGLSLDERMDAVADAVMRDVEIEHETPD
ncbi:MAG: hypothetical protein OXI23_12535 [Gemmatimonadota bacterium]|nr:hypothetical protein [Gemmatimonadota bacterium]